MSKSGTLFRNARLLDPASRRDEIGEMLVRDGVIAALGRRIDEPGEGAAIIDCRGACLAPGLVDMRVQLREPGAAHMENMVSASHAAASGGVTTMVALPNTTPPIDEVALVDYVKRRARYIGIVNVHTYAAITKGIAGKELAEMGLLAEAGALAFTDAERAVADAVVMRRALSYARTFDLLVMQHPEEPSLADGGAMNEGEMATRLGLQGI